MNINPRYYTESLQENWQGRNDGKHPDEQRWHQRIRCIHILEAELPPLSPTETAYALIGFRCDEGVKRNGGRMGAKDGPAAFRQASSNLPVHFNPQHEFLDLGDICCEDGDMEEAQMQLAEVIQEALQKGYTPLVIGGGHEVAYASFSGISQAISPGYHIGIINFDAHFDLREKGESGYSSGTGFLQIAMDCKAQGRTFNYLPIGIQKNGNTQQLFETARKLGVDHIPANLFTQEGQQELKERLSAFIKRCDYIYLTICLDVFAAAFAPGVSAPAFTGIYPDQFFFSCLELITKSNKLLSIDIAELNPTYDEAQRTSKLAAAIAFQLIIK